MSGRAFPAIRNTSVSIPRNKLKSIPGTLCAEHTTRWRLDVEDAEAAAQGVRSEESRGAEG